MSTRAFWSQVVDEAHADWQAPVILLRRHGPGVMPVLASLHQWPAAIAVRCHRSTPAGGHGRRGWTRHLRHLPRLKMPASQRCASICLIRPPPPVPCGCRTIQTINPTCLSAQPGVSCWMSRRRPQNSATEKTAPLRPGPSTVMPRHPRMRVRRERVAGCGHSRTSHLPGGRLLRPRRMRIGNRRRAARPPLCTASAMRQAPESSRPAINLEAIQGTRQEGPCLAPGRPRASGYPLQD